MVVALSQGLAEGAPGMETSSEGMLLVALTDKAQAARMLVLFGSHVLDVHLVSRTCVSLRPFRLLGSALALPSTPLTWQAFRLSLISTWLVWVPTHM